MVLVYLRPSAPQCAGEQPLRPFSKKSCRTSTIPAPDEQGPEPILELGKILGAKADLLFPGGRVVSRDHKSFGEALAATQRLMKDPNVPAVFEAAFEYNGVRIRADIVERLGAGLGSA